ncbi:Glycosyl hydrolases family 32 N-terminal domain/Glycosyl hydrolases family 32 C terminal, putative [Angomonas deanei]|uniref:beta-fructofuranosidase n=1 Tax=Angomonas deanei TaxID=59799 RepID=A0A7G2CLK7_9TRYP|nr:Glycosyl hydrolases family 32 N-terminal domain/Glycosyl hydrolases family 32 C terminal, putative [Angomonas deanei]
MTDKRPSALTGEPVDKTEVLQEYMSQVAQGNMLQVSHDVRVSTAREQHTKLWPMLRESKWYPRYHVAPPCGWLSVPHGLCFFNGLYHIFYQHNPFSEEWGTMHWGHCTSKDLVHWTHQPPALAPGNYLEGDKDGCFSGSAVSYKGVMYLFYTGHQWLDEETYDELYSSTSDTQTPDTHSSNAPQTKRPVKEGIYQQQCLAVSEDGITFTKRGPILKPPKGYIHCRDPKVWVQDDRWFMVVGARDEQDLGLLLLYSSSDPTRWNSSNYTMLAKTTDKNVFMWECPDFFPFGNEFALLVCPQGLQANGYRFRNTFPSGYCFGYFGADKTFSTSVNFTELDEGQDFYSPQSFVTPDGRRLMIGWLGGWGTNFPCTEDGWNSQLTLPRELQRDPKTGRMRQTPPRELKLLRLGEGTVLPVLQLADRTSAFICSCNCPHELELVFQLSVSHAERYGIWLGKCAQLYVDSQRNRLVLSRHYPEYYLCDERSCPIKDGATFLKLHLFLDTSSVEVFVDDGEHVLSARIYPGNKEEAVSFFCISGTAQLEKGTVWPLQTATFISSEEEEDRRRSMEEDLMNCSSSSHPSLASSNRPHSHRHGSTNTGKPEKKPHPLASPDVASNEEAPASLNPTHNSDLIAGGTAGSCYSLYPSHAS